MIGAAVVIIGGGAGVALAVTIHHHHKNPPHPTSTLAAPTTTAAPSGPPCPLTGAPSPTGSVPQRPALAIKVDNYPEARPQSGLDDADIVFEEPVEGGITRFVAVFQCQEARSVGPIRSARAVDAQILDQLSDPIFIHAGGIEPVISILQSSPLKDFNILDLPSITQINPERVAPYSTYTSTTDGWGLDPSDTTPPSPLFTYGPNPPAGTAVSSVNIPFSGTSDVTWTWNASAGKWMLAYSGQPAMLADGNEISTTNIVVQMVKVTYGPWVENSQGALEVQSQMTGSGVLDVFRDGEEISGTWQRPSLTSPATLVASDGSIIPLSPGPTWVEIVPNTISVTAS
ncbi:MAG TPA: DUF3048 domain-containing protein [Acidimicrobiales bacterium]|nr:DUF3048 domain-containing protein [Acidimicrobiales bacterium]